MNYKFLSEYRTFQYGTATPQDLMTFFSMNRGNAAYFFENGSFIGWLSLNTFAADNFVICKEHFQKDVINGFSDYITDHKKIHDFFISHEKISSVLVFSAQHPIGEFKLIDRHLYTFETQNKLDAVLKLRHYENELLAYLEYMGISNAGIIIPKGYEKCVPDSIKICSLHEIKHYDLVIDGYLTAEFSGLSDNITAVDDLLSCSILLDMEQKTEVFNNICFVDEPDVSGYSLYEDEMFQLSCVKDLKKAFIDKHYIEKIYEGYPDDLKYINKIRLDVYHSVVVSNNGAYRYISASKLENDFYDGRITPSACGNTNKLYFYGPCICYGIFTSKNSTIEEFLQQELNLHGIKMDTMNYGIPNGGYFLNDLFRMIYNDYPPESFHIFINRFSPYLRRFLKSRGYRYIPLTPYFKDVHYWFFNENVHLSPKGNKIAAKAIFSQLDFNNITPIPDLRYLRRIDPDERYYLKEHAVESYMENLKSIRFTGEGVRGFIDINASPLTNGHAYLIDYAAEHCDYLYVFVVEDNSNALPYYDRLQMITEYCRKYNNIKIISGSCFIGSKYTISAYFNKKYKMEMTPEKDVRNFDEIIMPVLDIDVRFMGTEPNSKITRELNEAYKVYMRQKGRKLCEIERLLYNNIPVSATTIRACLKNGDYDGIAPLVPDFVLKYLMQLQPDEMFEG